MQALSLVDSILSTTANYMTTNIASTTIDECKQHSSSKVCQPPKIILGSMEMGRQLDMKSATLITKEFLNNSTRFEIDTAYMYQGGKSEICLSSMNDTLLIPNNALISTKAYPNYEYALKPEGVRQQLEISLNRLKQKSVHIFYLHWPDHKNPLLDTLHAVNDLYKEGKFERFGISNYTAWQVAEIWYLCEANGFIKPSVYQGMYNAISRAVEVELFPCLRRFNIDFYAYCPLAGGVLTGKHKYEDNENNSIQKGRFYGTSYWSKEYRRRFWTQTKFAGIKLVQESLVDAYGSNSNRNGGNERVSMVEASLRWLMHHSKLNANDGVILGCSSYKHFVQNLAALEDKQPLADNVVEAFETAWFMSKGDDLTYFR